MPVGQAAVPRGLGLEPDAARILVQRGLDAAVGAARSEMRAIVERARESEHEIVACAVLVAGSMPDWSVEEILAVHFRMHKAEGVLFRKALSRAAAACDLRVVEIPEKDLLASAGRLRESVARLGKRAGAPWGKDQKEAAVAAMIGLGGRE
jgi:hypothetical protein